MSEKLFRQFIFIDPPAHQAGKAPEKIKDAPFSMIAPALLMALATIYFGIDTQVPLVMSDMAAEILLGKTHSATPPTIVLP